MFISELTRAHSIKRKRQIFSQMQLYFSSGYMCRNESIHHRPHTRLKNRYDAVVCQTQGFMFLVCFIPHYKIIYTTKLW